MLMAHSDLFNSLKKLLQHLVLTQGCHNVTSLSYLWLTITLHLLPSVIPPEDLLFEGLSVFTSICLLDLLLFMTFCYHLCLISKWRLCLCCFALSIYYLDYYFLYLKILAIISLNIFPHLAFSSSDLLLVIALDISRVFSSILISHEHFYLFISLYYSLVKFLSLMFYFISLVWVCPMYGLNIENFSCHSVFYNDILSYLNLLA